MSLFNIVDTWPGKHAKPLTYLALQQRCKRLRKANHEGSLLQTPSIVAMMEGSDQDTIHVQPLKIKLFVDGYEVDMKVTKG